MPAQGGLTYEASVEVRRAEDASAHGAYLQLRFLPSNQYVQSSLETETGAGDTFERVAVRGTAPPDTKRATVYLYTHRTPTPKLLLRSARLVSGVE